MTITVPSRVSGAGRAGRRAGGSATPGSVSRAAGLDRVLRGVTIGVLAPVTAWVIMRWFALPVDFHTYRYASIWALHGSDIYAGNIAGPGIGAGGLPYTYTPFALLALLPTTVGSWSTAYRVWGLAAVLAVAWAENAIAVRVIPLGSGMRRSAVLAGALTLTAASTMVVNEISMGQVNSLLMLACLADLFRPGHGRVARLIPPGTLVGVATAIKLTPGLFICYFVVTGQWRLARNSALAAAACMIAAAALYPAMSEQFLTSVMWHLPRLVAFGHSFSSPGNNSVQGILAAIGPWTSPVRAPSSIAVAALGLWAARVCHRLGHELEAWLIVGITAQLASPVSWTHHWIWLAPAVLLAALYARTTVQRTGTALAVVMLLIGPSAGQYLLVHGPPWALPLAVLQRECLVTAGIWCCVMFLIHAIRAPRGLGNRGPLVLVVPRGLKGGSVSIFGSHKTQMPAAQDALPGRASAMRVPERHEVLGSSLLPPYPAGTEVAEFALGCFWGAEKNFWQTPGVVSTAVGYEGGFTPNPTYEEVCSGRTGHSEAVRVVFDPSKVSYGELLRVFWESHDPTQGMRQGNDIGTQYRSAIFYKSPQQQAEAEQSQASYQQRLTEAGYGKITTEIVAAGEFYFAEDYHQQYLSDAKNPYGYCPDHGTGVSCPIGVVKASD